MQGIGGDAAVVMIAVVVAGCGHYGFDRAQSAPDDANRGDATDGAIDDAGNPVGPFQDPIAQTGLRGSASDWSPTLSEDLLEICFISDRNGVWEVFCSSRDDAAMGWRPPVLSSLSASQFDEYSVGLSADGLTVYLSQFVALTSEYDLVVASRVDRASPWSTPVAIDSMAVSGVAEDQPQPSADHLELWYLAEHAGYGAPQMTVSKRSAAGDPWPAGTLVTELADTSANLVSSPAASSSGVLYFSRQVAGGSYDLFRVAPDGSGFGVPEPIAELNTTLDETDVWISADQRAIAFVRRDALGNNEILIATR